MYNVEIAWMLSELADLTELKGDNPFKARAYRNVAKFLQRYPVNLASLDKNVLKEHLKKIPGVGKGIESLIVEIIETRGSEVLNDLKKTIPSELRQLLAIPGLGSTKVGVIFRELKITTIEELEKACRKKLIRELPGMGSKTEFTILRGIKLLKQGSTVVPYGLGLAIAEEFTGFLLGLPNVNRVVLAGDLRRGVEITDRVVILISGDGKKDLFEITKNHPLIKEKIAEVEGSLTVKLWLGLSVEFYFASEKQFSNLLFFLTGSQEHWERVGELLEAKGYKLKEQEILTAQGEPIIIDEESKIYQLAGIPCISPELRENTGELEAALEDRLPILVQKNELKGDLHMHTNWSDGVGSIEEMVDKAQGIGYEYIAITDHSKSLGVAKGLKEERLFSQHQKIQELNKNLTNFTVLTGIEMDILSDGRLDYNDELLANMDVVIASIHSGFQQGKAQITDRIINAIKNEHVDIIAHPTGRLLGRREPYEVDLEKVLEMAAKYNTALEINSSPDRLDLSSYWVRRAKEMGVKIAINTDAHDVSRLEEIRFGLGVGRKGWLCKEDVLNCLTLDELQKHLN